MALGKWIAGGLGWALGGPIGALIGFGLGSLLEGTTVQTSVSTQRTTEADFKISLLVLIACIMKADGKILKSELAVAKKFLVTNYGEEQALEALQILKDLLNKDINEEEVAAQIGLQMNYSSKLELLHLLFMIAYADGEVHPLELEAIQRIAANFRISSVDFDSVRAPYTQTVDRDWAYKTLELEPTATNEEIKKAYRRMAMKYHPDKVGDLGEDVKKSATERFRTINEAYEAIKKERGIA
ncbi:MAG: TerB family tellurite resistance protein [Bacteroidales bacterium]